MPNNPTAKQRRASVINLSAARRSRRAKGSVSKLTQHVMWTDRKTGLQYPAIRDYWGTTFVNRRVPGKKVKT